jgi:hypothetical protein
LAAWPYNGSSGVEIAEIIKAVQANRVRVPDHAYQEAETDGLSFDEICFSATRGELIKDYPTDKPYPSCLIYGRTFGSDPVHSVWAYNKHNRWAVLITVYRPDLALWIDGRQRRG